MKPVRQEATIIDGKIYRFDSNAMYVGAYVDENGDPIDRTPQTHPYSYDGYVTWRGGENNQVNNSVWSDRLLQWDHEKYNRLSKKYFGDEGQYFDQRKPGDIEKFLRDWYDDPKLKLIIVMKYCNVSSGYPVWRFDMKQPRK